MALRRLAGIALLGAAALLLLVALASFGTATGPAECTPSSDPYGLGRVGCDAGETVLEGAGAAFGIGALVLSALAATAGTLLLRPGRRPHAAPSSRPA